MKKRKANLCALPVHLLLCIILFSSVQAFDADSVLSEPVSLVQTSASNFLGGGGASKAGTSGNAPLTLEILPADDEDTDDWSNLIHDDVQTNDFAINDLSHTIDKVSRRRNERNSAVTVMNPESYMQSSPSFMPPWSYMPPAPSFNPYMMMPPGYGGFPPLAMGQASLEHGSQNMPMPRFMQTASASSQQDALAQKNLLLAQSLKKALAQLARLTALAKKAVSSVAAARSPAVATPPHVGLPLSGQSGLTAAQIAALGQLHQLHAAGQLPAQFVPQFLQLNAQLQHLQQQGLLKATPPSPPAQALSPGVTGASLSPGFQSFLQDSSVQSHVISPLSSPTPQPSVPVPQNGAINGPMTLPPVAPSSKLDSLLKRLDSLSGLPK
eukprot:GILI01008442.1.p1 GENE.GILI01008442.1~~GILI01008442.1.p1  ORF type:complete len:382 (+),score=97.68 GILI01008442.1:118-1263(+)